jgi:hypothetical protein
MQLCNKNKMDNKKLFLIMIILILEAPAWRVGALILILLIIGVLILLTR